MKFGLSDSNYMMFLRAVIEPLKNSGAELFVFGSRATGKNHQFSDLDLLIVPPKTRAEFVKVLSSVKESIEESHFPIKVDFVLLDDLAESYRGTVLRERVQI